MAFDEAGEDVGEIGFGIDAVQFAGLDKRGVDGPMLATAVRSREECVLSIESERTNGAFDDVGVDLDVAIDRFTSDEALVLDFLREGGVGNKVVLDTGLPLFARGLAVGPHSEVIFGSNGFNNWWGLLR